VATGIGGEPRLKEEAPAPVTTPRKVEEDFDYKRFERPTVIRNRDERFGADNAAETNTDYLDIPAFLRRQAD